MYVMTKEQAQEWLNRPENEDVYELNCYGPLNYAVWDRPLSRERQPFAVDYKGVIQRKTPWHWPKPDESTTYRARGFGTNEEFGKWCVLNFGGKNADGFCCVSGSLWKYFVLANPDNLDEVPPIGLEV